MDVASADLNLEIGASIFVVGIFEMLSGDSVWTVRKRFVSI